MQLENVPDSFEPTGPNAYVNLSKEVQLDRAARESLREAIRINTLEMERLRLALKEREERAAQLSLAATAIDGAIEMEVQALQGEAAVPEGFAARKRERRGSLAWETRRHSYTILKRAARPMDRKELLRELTDIGLRFNPKNPLQALTKILSTAKEFRSTDYGYWISDEPVPTVEK